VKISLEFKPKEPRNFSYLARSADTLLFVRETGTENVGVTIDVGHALFGDENVAGWWSMDQYPYREDGRQALQESIEWIKALLEKLHFYGIDKIDRLIRNGNATETTHELRRLLLG